MGSFVFENDSPSLVPLKIGFVEVGIELLDCGVGVRR
jgi:hypothetical protein